MQPVCTVYEGPEVSPDFLLQYVCHFLRSECLQVLRMAEL